MHPLRFILLLALCALVSLSEPLEEATVGTRHDSNAADGLRTLARELTSFGEGVETFASSFLQRSSVTVHNGAILASARRRGGSKSKAGKAGKGKGKGRTGSARRRRRRSGTGSASAARRRRRRSGASSKAARRRRRRRRRSASPTPGGGAPAPAGPSTARSRRRRSSPSPSPPSGPSPSPPRRPSPSPSGPSPSPPAGGFVGSDFVRRCSSGSKRISPGTSASQIASAAKSGSICLTTGRHREPLSFNGLGRTVVEAEEGAWIDGTVDIPDSLWRKDTSVGAGVYKADVSSICRDSSLIETEEEHEDEAAEESEDEDTTDEIGNSSFSARYRRKGGKTGKSGGGGGGKVDPKAQPQTGCLWQLFLGDRAVTDARWPNVEVSVYDEDTTFNHEPRHGSAYTEIGTGGTWAKQGSGSEYTRLQSAKLASLKKSVPGAMLVVHKWNVKTGVKGDGTLDGQDVSYTKVKSHQAGSTQLTYSPHDQSYYGGNPSNWRLNPEKIDHGFFYLTAHLGLLDKEDEWFYDPSKQTVWVWPKGGGPPRGARARKYSNMLRATGCKGTTFRGLQVFAGSVVVEKSNDITIEGGRFLYGSAGMRMQGSVKRADDALYTASGSGLTIQHNEFGFSESRFACLRTTKNYFYNNYLHNCCWGSTEAGAVSDKKGGQTIWRRNTIHTIGKGCGIKTGPGGTRAEYNLIYNLYYDTDSSNLQIPTGSAAGSVAAHNWLLFGWSRNGLRYDGDPAGEHGLSYRTVAFNNNQQFRVKGNYHWFLQNTGFGHGPAKTDASFAKNKWCAKSDMVQKGAGVGCPKGAMGGNSGTKQYNSALGTGSGKTSYSEFAGTASKGAASGMWVARLEGASSKGQNQGDAIAVCNELRDPLNLDFRPRPGSKFIDKGTNSVSAALQDGGRFWKSNREKGYEGWAAFVEAKLGKNTDLQLEVEDGRPDIGAYESDPDEYWIAGRRLSRSAATPVPFDGAEGVSAEVDLMWLPAEDCAEQGCSQSVTLDGKVVGTVKAPKNVVRLPKMSAGSTHKWSVQSSGMSTSPTWSFTVARSQSEVCGRMTGVGHGEGDSAEYDKETSGGGGGGGSSSGKGGKSGPSSSGGSTSSPRRRSSSGGSSSSSPRRRSSSSGKAGKSGRR